MAMAELDKIERVEVATNCLICEKPVPVFGRGLSILVCKECKEAVFELKFLLKQIMPYNPILVERLEKYRESMDQTMMGGAENGL